MLVPHVVPEPSHTPHTSSFPLAQHHPPPSSTPAQHAPPASTARAEPLHTPQASSPRGLAQQSPLWSRAPAQQAPLRSCTPLSGHGFRCPQSAPLYPASHAHTRADTLQEPCPLHGGEAEHGSHASVPHSDSDAGAGPLPAQEAKDTAPWREPMQRTVRSMAPPPHDVLHGAHSPTTHAKVSHGHPLHASSPAGCGAAEHAPLPPGAGAPLTRQATERLRAPPPHGAEQADQGPVLQCATLQLLVHASTTAGRAATEQSAEPTTEAPSATQATGRVRKPGPQEALHGPQSPTTDQLYAGHATLLHACSAAGAAPRPAAVHASGGDVAPVRSRHVTARVWVPPPHGAEQADHSAVTQP
jgi:hypothetical protein